MASFVEDYRAGLASAAQLDDYIDRWHADPSDLSLPEFLGFTSQQYARWVADAQCLLQLLNEPDNSTQL